LLLLHGQRCVYSSAAVSLSFGIVSLCSFFLAGYAFWKLKTILKKKKGKFLPSAITAFYSSLSLLGISFSCYSVFSLVFARKCRKTVATLLELQLIGLAISGFFSILSLLNVCMLWVEAAAVFDMPKGNLKKTKTAVSTVACSYLVLSIIVFSVKINLFYFAMICFFYAVLFLVFFLNGSKIISKKLKLINYQAAKHSKLSVVPKKSKKNKADSARRKIHLVAPNSIESSPNLIDEQSEAASKGTQNVIVNRGLPNFRLVKQNSVKSQMKALRSVLICTESTSKLLWVLCFSIVGECVSFCFPLIGPLPLLFVVSRIICILSINVRLITYASSSDLISAGNFRFSLSWWWEKISLQIRRVRVQQSVGNHRSIGSRTTVKR